MTKLPVEQCEEAAAKSLLSAVAKFIQTRGVMRTAELLYTTADTLIGNAYDQGRLPSFKLPAPLKFAPVPSWRLLAMFALGMLFAWALR